MPSMAAFTLKPNFLGNILVRLVSFIVLVFLARFAYIFTVKGKSCNSGDFCFLPETLTLNIAGSNPNSIDLPDSGTDLRNYYYSIFQDLIADGFISPNSHSLCIETLTGQDVEALINVGVIDSIGIFHKSSPPLIRYGHGHHQPFDDDTFHFEFAGNGVLDRSSKPVEFAKEVYRTLKPGGIFVIHTISKDDYSLNSLIQLFSSFKLISSIEIDSFTTWRPRIRQVIFKKVTQFEPMITHCTKNTCVDFEKSKNYCYTPEYKRELIRKAESLIEKEPFQWIKLRNVKYLSSMVDISFKKRYIYVDVGARSYSSSIGSWFNKQYPKQNKTFEVYAIEGDREYHDEYRRKGVNLLPYAAWLRNETLFFEIARVQTRKNVEKGRGLGRVQSAQSSLDFLWDSDKIMGFDFAGWLMSLVDDERDYLVVKMDVKGNDREALSYAERMSGHPSVKITLIHFTRSGNAYENIVGGSEIEKRHVDSPILLQLAKRNNEDSELGVVVGVLAASEFESETLVLVVQQQTRLWGLHDPEESTHLRRINL
ncbi:hypothetical protein MTR67_025409 [Solanum verrucosum]|uniref:DUF7870 domain-containing protein n=1 Tax=Solanum verrucosum TaxID=315347 RepID=A0AAF0QX49_SOLVR|nr:hypothetical protein MTR67_025409 [Solanum verrucosum]